MAWQDSCVSIIDMENLVDYISILSGFNKRVGDVRVKK